MKKRYILTGIAALFAAFGLSANVNAGAKSNVAPGSPSLNVYRVYNNARSISGNASRGVKVYAKLNGKTLGTSRASKKNGHFTIRLNKKVNTNSRVYVYAQRGRINFYNIIDVQARVAKKTAKKSTTTKKIAKKTTSKKTTNKKDKKATKKSSRSNLIKASNIAGQWNSNKSNGYSQRWTFNNTYGLNMDLYKNNRFNKHLVRNATYYLKAVNKDNLYRVTYKGRGQKHYSTFYLRLTSTKHFNISGKKSQNASLLVNGSKAKVASFEKK
ncbi:hypothetical protein WR164_13600 [Philodulcilactobacillus myokoensis]|uniref:Bacterial Ig domain-containing protein n=1 Tax=Philodulcilactobacillus myokoensis TaxID=2929573 RepID=A0A9W6B228_9LACO|nr:hypothetical protein [Philodulcilactobacillus myokoensis]GLB47381.1 hypothetical protein WR164_13600 [Philodulcilactobacillus myokoensis]